MTGDPDDARDVPAAISQEVNTPSCVRCLAAVPGARTRWTLCPACARQDFDDMVRRQQEIAEGKRPFRRSMVNGQLVDEYLPRPEVTENDVTPPKPEPKALAAGTQDEALPFA